MDDHHVDPSPSLDADAFNTFEADGWEHAAGGYDQLIGAVSRALAAALLDAVDIQPGAHLLDVATGPGHVAALAATRGAHVVGIDIAAAMVDLAHIRYPGMDVRHGDAEQLPFADTTFDAVVANLAILHVGRPEGAVAEAARVLRPGGRAAWTTWDQPDRARILGVMLESLAEVGATPPPEIPAGPPFFRFADDTAFVSLLESAGLREVTVQRIAFDHPIASAEALWRGLVDGSVRTSALVRGQSPEIRERVRAAFDRRAMQYAVGGRLELPVSVVLATGRRPA